MIEMGESLVGAYLRYLRGCEMVLYNERTDHQGEIDVIGVRGGEEPEVWMCEVATHIAGLGYGASFDAMTKKIEHKLERAAAFAAKLFPQHAAHVEFWAPYVPEGKTTEWFEAHVAKQAAANVDIRFVINKEYADRVQELIYCAAGTTSAPSEPAFRLLQILTHVKGGGLTLK